MLEVCGVGQLNDSGVINGPAGYTATWSQQGVQWPSWLHSHLVTIRHTQACVVCGCAGGQAGLPVRDVHVGSQH